MKRWTPAICSALACIAAWAGLGNRASAQATTLHAAERKPLPVRLQQAHHPLEIVGDDGSALRLGGQLQFRYAATLRDENQPGDTDNFVGGFEMRRARLRAAYRHPEHRLEAVAQGQFAPNGGAFSLLDAWVRFSPREGWKLRAGQFVLPFDREVMTSNSRRLGTEQSLVGQAVGASAGSGRVQGLELTRTSDHARHYFSINDGVRSNNTPSSTVLGAQSSADFALTVRTEHLLFGEFSTFREMYAVPGQEPGVLLGGAIHAERRELDADQDGRFDDALLDARATLDLSHERDGLNMYAALFGMRQSAQNAPDLTRLGALLQAGALLDDDTQLFARYEYAEDSTQSDNLSAVSLGLNEFIHDEAFRFTAEIYYFFDPVTGGFVNPLRNVLADSPSQSGQMVFRAQIQLLF